MKEKKRKNLSDFNSKTTPDKKQNVTKSILMRKNLGGGKNAIC